LVEFDFKKSLPYKEKLVFLWHFLVHEQITREIPLLWRQNSPFWNTPKTMFFVQKNMESLEEN